MTREERSDYPYKAVREVLVNALIHRNYQILGSEIHVKVFDDRLEITSPGGMMNGRRVQDMDIRHIPSMRRNQVISDVFSRLGFMERRGSGIDRILNSYVEVAQKPTFYSDSDFFIVTLPNRSVATPAQISMESVASDSEKVSTLMQAEAKRDKEIADFSKMVDTLPLANSTKVKITKLFKKYGYRYTFNTNNVENVFEVKEARARVVVRQMREYGFVKKNNLVFTGS